jgi:hypothetical protein
MSETFSFIHKSDLIVSYFWQNEKIVEHDAILELTGYPPNMTIIPEDGIPIKEFIRRVINTKLVVKHIVTKKYGLIIPLYQPVELLTKTRFVEEFYKRCLISLTHKDLVDVQEIIDTIPRNDFLIIMGDNPHFDVGLNLFFERLFPTEAITMQQILPSLLPEIKEKKFPLLVRKIQKKSEQLELQW